MRVKRYGSTQINDDKPATSQVCRAWSARPDRRTLGQSAASVPAQLAAAQNAAIELAKLAAAQGGGITNRVNATAKR